MGYAIRPGAGYERVREIAAAGDAGVTPAELADPSEPVVWFERPESHESVTVLDAYLGLFRADAPDIPVLPGDERALVTAADWLDAEPEYQALADAMRVAAETHSTAGLDRSVVGRLRKRLLDHCHDGKLANIDPKSVL